MSRTFRRVNAVWKLYNQKKYISYMLSCNSGFAPSYISKNIEGFSKFFREQKTNIWKNKCNKYTQFKKQLKQSDKNLIIKNDFDNYTNRKFVY